MVEENSRSFHVDKNNNKFHIVIYGDYLGKIARIHNMTLDRLLKINNLPNDSIKEGQKLKIE